MQIEEGRLGVSHSSYRQPSFTWFARCVRIGRFTQTCRVFVVVGIYSQYILSRLLGIDD